MALTPLWLDLILLGVAAEALLLAAWAYRRQATGRLPGLLANLTAGASLLLALRSTLADQQTVALVALTAALVAHLIDLKLRLS